MTSDALIRRCGLYRYWLTRLWCKGGDVAKFVMLNPSTADASIDDPTIRRCVGFAKAWGCGGIYVVNLFALRATDPAALRTHPDPVGPDNMEWLAHQPVACKVVVAAWGVHGAYRSQDRKVVAALKNAGVPLHSLGWTAKGHPRHPLYLPAAAELVLFPGFAHLPENGEVSP